MLTKCTYCGEHSRIQQEGNACHTCMSGIMVRDKEWEDNPYFLTRSEFDELMPYDERVAGARLINGWKGGLRKMVIALIASRRYKIRCKDGKIWWAIENTGDSPCAIGPFEYGKKITFVAQGDAYYYPWTELQNVNQR